MACDWPALGRRKTLLLGGAVLLVFLAFSLSLFYAAWQGVISNGVASLVASLLLVFVTLIYASITLWMAIETHRSRQQEIKPVLEFRPREYHSSIVNIGNGPARDIDLTLTLEPEGDSRTVQWQSLAPGQEIAITVEPFSSIADREYIGFQLYGIDTTSEVMLEEDALPDDPDEFPYQTLTMVGTCEDAWENRQDVDEEYDVRNLTEAMVGTAPSTMDEAMSLESLAIDVDRIRAHLEDAEDDS